MKYIKTPIKKYNVKEGKTMTKQAKVKEVKASRKYAPSRLEVFKTVLIAVMITSIVAFIGGMQFQAKQQARIEQAVQALTPSAEATPVKK